MTFSVRTVTLIERMQYQAEALAADDGEPLQFPFLEIVDLFVSLLPKVLPLFAACKKQPPTPPPVPQPLAAVGVQQTTWEHALGAKFAAQNARSNSPRSEEGFDRAVIVRMAREIAKEKSIKPKKARPLAIASLKSALAETPEDLAMAMQQALSNNH